MTTHVLDASQPHTFWDNSHPARLRIESGDTVVFETLDASAGQITPESVSRDLSSVHFSPIQPLTGPVFVANAEPGDILEVEVLHLDHQGWGWSCIRPEAGLLACDFPEPYLHHYRIEGGACRFNKDIAIPYRPFCGVMGLAPTRPGRFDTAPPTIANAAAAGGLLGPGSKVAFPVHAPGGLFSCGDGHASRGRGEVSGTGIESPMTATLRFRLFAREDAAVLGLDEPRGALTQGHRNDDFATSAFGPDLYQNAQQAVRYMIDHLTATYGLSRREAYCLCGAAVDLEIAESGDEAGTRAASAKLPRSLFRKRIAA